MKNKKIHLLFSLSFSIVVVTWWSFAAIGPQGSSNESGITREELERDVWHGAIVGYDAVTNTIIK